MSHDGRREVRIPIIHQCELNMQYRFHGMHDIAIMIQRNLREPSGYCHSSGGHSAPFGPATGLPPESLTYSFGQIGEWPL